jgi:hypothetical protein
MSDAMVMISFFVLHGCRGKRSRRAVYSLLAASSKEKIARNMELRAKSFHCGWASEVCKFVLPTVWISDDLAEVATASLYKPCSLSSGSEEGSVVASELELVTAVVIVFSFISCWSRASEP